jgi:hypothetical protein
MLTKDWQRRLRRGWLRHLLCITLTVAFTVSSSLLYPLIWRVATAGTLYVLPDCIGLGWMLGNRQEL